MFYSRGMRRKRSHQCSASGENISKGQCTSSHERASGIEPIVRLYEQGSISSRTSEEDCIYIHNKEDEGSLDFICVGKLIGSYYFSPFNVHVIVFNSPVIPSMKASSNKVKQFLANPSAQKPIQVHSVCNIMPDQEESKRTQYPLDSNSYRILDEIGVGASAIVYKAICIPLNSTPVAIKSIDLDGSKGDLDDFRREAKTLSLLSHPNILNAHCSFTVDHRLWVVMPFMSAGSLQSIVSSSFPDGLSEPCIAIILRETLNALAYLHDQGHLHRDIKAGNILMDSTGSVKLADFGVSASIFEFSSNNGWSSSSSSSSSMLTDVTGTPYWMAPEVFHSHNGYNFKADIWSFGITALELAHGRPPLSHLPLSKSLLMKITKQFRFSDYEQQKNEKKSKFSKAFKDMVASCLDQEPSRRPSAEKLLKHHFFKNCKGLDFLVKNLLQGLPSVEDRFRQTKLSRELSMITEDEEVENGMDEGRPIVKERRISGWNFNEDIFELDPVFPTESANVDSEVKPVHFAEDTRMEEGKNGGKGSEVIDRESMITGLMVLKSSLEEQREKVVYLINLLRGGEEGGGREVNREEEMAELIERLKMELDYERKKKVELAMEVEFLKLQL